MMNGDASSVLDDHKGISVEVSDTEKQLWTLIHSKGLLHPGVKLLYQRACGIYEKIILNDYQLKDLQDAEYRLWKLHYKHIDEFRRRIRKSSASAESIQFTIPHALSDEKNNNDNYVEGFKLFLAEATEYYKYLVLKIRERCGLSEETIFLRKDDSSSLARKVKVDKCRFSCHRFLVCLGDLARYKEFYGSPDIKSCNWSVAAAYYLEATRTWPDSGNPHNQLAVLATYVGDEFLALYHCVRSLAVKEPFPDAWANLLLLLEKNSATHLSFLSDEASFDFSRSSIKGNVHTVSTQTDLWPLVVRVISFFYMKSRLEDFNCAFASAVSKLEGLLALDEKQLKETLDSCLHMSSAKSGPLRAVHFVSVLIFVIEDLMRRSELDEAKDSSGVQPHVLANLSWTSTFLFMARLVDRCLEGNSKDSSPLLSAVLVFSEWLVGVLDELEKFTNDEEIPSAMSYFSSFTGLVNQLIDIKGEISHHSTALWEDNELQGFSPLVHAHDRLEFLLGHDDRNDCRNGNMCRINRIMCVAMKIVNRSSSCHKWMSYDKSNRKFYLPELNILAEKRILETEPEKETGGSLQSLENVTEETDVRILGEELFNPTSNHNPVGLEEEEVILFKPITRYNSLPICTSATTSNHISPLLEGISSTRPSSEDCLRRASSLLIAQNQEYIDRWVPENKNSTGIESPRQQEPCLTESPISAGPPSLNAWVLNRESMSNDGGKVTSELHKHSANPVDGASSISLTALSISETEAAIHDTGPITTATRYSSPPYTAPIPSAPRLPDDALWLSGDSYVFPQEKSGGSCLRDSYVNASQGVGYSIWKAASETPAFAKGYSPFFGLPGTFERFHHYKNDCNLEWGDSKKWPVHLNVPGNLRDLHALESSRFGLFDRWGNPLASNSMIYLESPTVYPGFPLAYGSDEQVRNKHIHGFVKPSSYAYDAGEDPRIEQQPLLQYLKEKEWELQRQREAQFRGSPTYVGTEHTV